MGSGKSLFKLNLRGFKKYWPPNPLFRAEFYKSIFYDKNLLW
jgi:hypothetical protein